MAEALAKYKAAHLNVKSSGVFASEGSCASENTMKALEENGIQLNHSSQALTKELVEWADYIFTMTTSHKQLVGSSFPIALDKTFTLKEYGGYQNHDVLDPFGGALEVYRETYKELDEAIVNMLKKIDK
jgi:protein arginine phosphatase